MYTLQEITIKTVHPIWYRLTLLAHRQTREYYNHVFLKKGLVRMLHIFILKERFKIYSAVEVYFSIYIYYTISCL